MGQYLNCTTCLAFFWKIIQQRVWIQAITKNKLMITQCDYILASSVIPVFTFITMLMNFRVSIYRFNEHISMMKKTWIIECPFWFWSKSATNCVVNLKFAFVVIIWRFWHQYWADNLPNSIKGASGCELTCLIGAVLCTRIHAPYCLWKSSSIKVTVQRYLHVFLCAVRRGSDTVRRGLAELQCM